MKEKLEEIFERLQHMEIRATLTNMETLLKTLYDLRNIYNELEAEENGRREADPEGPDDD